MEDIAMAQPLVTDDLWAAIEPLLPKRRKRPRGGRPPVDDRATLTGILFVLKTGIPWEYLPQEMDCGSGMTCWRRLRDWQRAGVWKHLHKLLLDRLRAADKIDFSRAVADSSTVRAVGGGKKRAQTPRTGVSRARSTTSSRMRKAFRWPFDSRGPTGTT
jgi:transposase